MLLRFLSATGALCLSSCAALSLPPSPASPTPDIDLDVVPQPPTSHILSHFRQIKVPCAECSFTDSCDGSSGSNSYLTLSFTTENTTLLANDDPIFPSTVPMQFHALRHWAAGQQAVLLAYALDARPLPPTPGALLGDIFLLKLKLFDLHGRPASDHLVSISLAKDTAGDLLISDIESVPFHGRGGGGHRRPRPSWLARLGESLEAVKSAAQSCWEDAPPAAGNDRVTGTAHGAVMDAHRTMAPNPNPHRPGGYRPPYWMGRGGSGNGAKMLQPVVLPALLGVIAGIVACLTGFIVGRTVIAVYYCFRGAGRRRGGEHAVVPAEGVADEKERLMEEMDDESR
ncbi:hypothetical protein HFD88_000999 [Aspergillus terreus]|nr:hypothetical protein HFD88_000999 [Aspergillus terreus]